MRAVLRAVPAAADKVALAIIMYTSQLSTIGGPITIEPKLDELIKMFEMGEAHAAVAPVIEFDDTMDAEALLEHDAVDDLALEGDIGDDGECSEDKWVNM